MARVLKLVYGATQVDLLNGTLKLAQGGFSFQTASEAVWDTFDLIGQGTDSVIRAAIGQIDELFEYAERYTENKFESEPLWLYWQSDGESAKRALVYTGAISIPGDDINSPLLGMGALGVSLAILHDPFYEAETPTVLSTSGVSANGGGWYPGLGPGTKPARINKLKITTGSALAMTRFWIGIKPTRKGNTGFIGLWEAELGLNFTDAADTADATASGSSKVRINFGTQTAMAKRMTLSWDNIASANFDDLIGSYLVLCRCKVDAASTEVALKLAQGWAGAGSKETPVGVTYISGNTNWYLHELGEIHVPPTGDRDGIASTNEEIRNFFLVLSAERLSAAGYIDIDAFILIPSEHLLLIDCIGIVSGLGELHAFSPNADAPYVLFKTASGGLYGNTEYSFTNWRYPLGGGLLVAAAQGEANHALTNTLNFELTLSYRWRGYRA